MPIYHKLGNIPHKRHTTFRKKDGSLYHEQLFGTIGFDGMSSLLYHHYPPTMVLDLLNKTDVAPKIAVDKNLKMTSLQGFDVQPTDDFLESRKTVLMNNDCKITLASPKKSMNSYFYKNADADEVIFIHK